MIRLRCIERRVLAILLAGLAAGTVGAAPIDESEGTPNFVDRASNASAEANEQRPNAAGSLRELENLPDMRLAHRAFVAGEVAQCREHLRDAYAKHPHLPPPELMLARLYLSSGDLPSGRRLLEEVSIASPDHPELFLMFGKLALLDGHVTDAMLQFDRAAKAELPDNWTAAQRGYFQAELLSGQTKIAELRRDWGQAARLYQQRLKSEPQNAALRDRLAMMLFRDGQSKPAFEQFDIAYRQDSSMSRPEVSMAVMCVEAADYRKSDAWFQTALQRAPDDARVHFQRSIALMYEDRADEAIRHVAKAKQLGLESDELRMHSGLIALQLGKTDQAEELFRQVAERSSSADATVSLTLALAEQEDAAKRAQALEVIKLLAESQPDRPMVKTALGWAQFRNGNVDAAEATLRAAAAEMPQERTTLYFLSRVLAAQTQQKEAREVGERLSRLIERPGILAFRPAARKWLDQLLETPN